MTRRGGVVACAALLIPVLAAAAATGPTITATGAPRQCAAWVVGVFAAAWLVSRLSGRLATWIVRRQEARHLSADDPADTGVMTSLKRRETAVSLVRTSVRYAAYGLALVLAFGALSL